MLGDTLTSPLFFFLSLSGQSAYSKNLVDLLKEAKVTNTFSSVATQMLGADIMWKLVTVVDRDIQKCRES